MAGKGDKSRVTDFKAYRNNPLWDNLGKKEYASWSEFSNEVGPIIDAMEEAHKEKTKKFLFLDDMLTESTLNNSVDENKE